MLNFLLDLVHIILETNTLYNISAVEVMKFLRAEKSNIKYIIIIHTKSQL